jgi:hypothetical protein
MTGQDTAGLPEGLCDSCFQKLLACLHEGQTDCSVHSGSTDVAIGVPRVLGHNVSPAAVHRHFSLPGRLTPHRDPHKSSRGPTPMSLCLQEAKHSCLRASHWSHFAL